MGQKQGQRTQAKPAEQKKRVAVPVGVGGAEATVEGEVSLIEGVLNRKVKAKRVRALVQKKKKNRYICYCGDIRCRFGGVRLVKPGDPRYRCAARRASAFAIPTRVTRD